MKKIAVNNTASVVIIFRQKNPAEVFLEIKDDKYPMRVFQRCLNIIGGNWIGEQALNDFGPLGTLYRELQEEITPIQ